MRRLRVSILGLMGLIAFVAVGTAALVTPSEWWAEGLLAATMGLLGVALLGVIYRREARRAFWVGFAIFGWGYTLACFAPGLESSIGARLVTTRLLDRAHAAIASPESGEFVMSWVLTPETQIATDGDGDGVIDLTWAGSINGNYLVTTGGPIRAGAVPTARPSGVTPEVYRWIGHCLLAVVIATLGGLLARRFHATCGTAGTPQGKRPATDEAVP